METPLFDRLRLKTLYEKATTRDLFILFIVAFFFGAGIKVLVRDAVTIGYDDYTLPRQDTLVDLNILEKELIKQGTPKRAPVPSGDTCSQEA